MRDINKAFWAGQLVYCQPRCLLMCSSECSWILALIFPQGLISIEILYVQHGFYEAMCLILSPAEIGQVSINECPSLTNERWFQWSAEVLSERSWLGAPKRRGWEGIEASVFLTGLTGWVSFRTSSLPGLYFPTSISHLPGLLTPKPGVESKILPSILTAGSEEQTEDITRYRVHL